MEETTHPAGEPAEQEIVITRLIDAPLQFVYKAWTIQSILARWWGPKDFTNPVCELDVKPSGEIRIDMRAPDGTIYPMGGIFHEIIEPDTLVFTTTAFKDAEGKWKLEVLNTVNFDAKEGKTQVTISARIIERSPETESSVAGMETGWNQSLDRLEEVLKDKAAFENL